MKKGQITFTSTNRFLEDRFKWAKEMALSYSHDGQDPVGPWYEAALPERNSFCIRDISHQIYGATFLGLNSHTKNMLHKFVKHIAESRDYCTYWEINKEDQPTEVDYTNDSDFWYVLLANFELLVACYQQYLYTGDEDFIYHPDFTRFYDYTFNEYMAKWDKDGDGILEHYQSYGRRGLASYNEVETSVLQGGDMLAVEYAGYLSYSKILELRQETSKAELYSQKAETIRKMYLSDWYDSEQRRFYGAKKEDGEFYEAYFEEGNFLPLYFGVFDNDEKLQAAQKQLKDNPVKNVEGLTYMPQIFYRHDDHQTGFDFLTKLMAEDLDRQEYPEVSYSIVANVVSGLMGVEIQEYLHFEVCNNSVDATQSRLRDVPLFGGTLNLDYETDQRITVAYTGNENPHCQVKFNGSYQQCIVNGTKQPMEQIKDFKGNCVSFVSINCEKGITYTIQPI